MRIAGSFSGTGGIELGFRQAGHGIVWANENNPRAAETYTANFGTGHLDTRSIWDVDPAGIPDHDVFVGGFPCQAFSHAGERLGFEDIRGTLFQAIARIIETKWPAAFLLENVKGLIGHDNGNTLRVIIQTLQELGYNIDWKVMNSADYGNLPQGRERIYIAGIHQDLHAAMIWPEPVPLTVRVQDLLETGVTAKYYYDERYGHISDMVNAAVTDDAVYTYRSYGNGYVRRNESGVVPTLMANMGSGGHNVPILRDPQTGRARRATPRECFNFQGYPANYTLPPLADGHLYKQAGNAVSVPVIRRIADAMAGVLEAVTV